MTAFLKDCRALGHELLPENGEGTRAKLKRLVKSASVPKPTPATSPGNRSGIAISTPAASSTRKRTSTHEPPSRRPNARQRSPAGSTGATTLCTGAEGGLAGNLVRAGHAACWYFVEDAAEAIVSAYVEVG
ncbi:hypothetical protein GCM10009577_46240 [Streptomyces javensis]